MTSNTSLKTNRGNKQEQTQAAVAELLATAARQGFYGTASLTLNVQDGHIQHVKISTERMMR